MNITIEIEKLLTRALEEKLLEGMDYIDARNALLDLMRQQEPASSSVSMEQGDSIPAILERMVQYAQDHGMIDDSTDACIRFDTRIMGLLTPKPSVIQTRFDQIRRQESIRAATDYFYRQSIASNYIRMADIQKNQSWQQQTPYGMIQITINLAKPEKDPHEIARARLTQKKDDRDYPRCPICIENINYPGRPGFPARQNLRMIPLVVNGDRWYLQYSPYVYYNEHCIVISERHEPMTISRQTFQDILSFVSQFPHYFCGANADLPIVGGSILSHNHYQGGRADLPMTRAKILRSYRHADFPVIQIDQLNWPLTVLRLTANSPALLVELASRLLACWRGYSDPSVGILAETNHDGHCVPHNTITPIARLNDTGSFELDLVLRNNRTTNDLPLGLFHPHPAIHPIKKENIGLIEVMGLAILPGRLKAELAGIRSILNGQESAASIRDPDHRLWKHRDWIDSLLSERDCSDPSKPMQSNAHDFDRILETQVGLKFLQGLEQCGVFKNDAAGLAAMNRFAERAGLFQIQSSNRK